MDKKIFIELAKDVYQLTLLFPAREPLRYKLREVADDIVAEIIVERNDYFGNIRRYLEVVYGYLDIAAGQNWVAPARIDLMRENYLLAAQQLTEMKLAQEIALETKIKNEPAPPRNEEPIAPNPDFVLVPEPPKIEITAAPPRDLMEPEIPPAPMVMEPPAIELEKEKSASAAGESALAAAAISQEAAVIDEDLEEAAAEDFGGEGNPKDGLTSSQIMRQNRIARFLKEQGSAQVWEIQKIFPDVSKRTIRRDFRSMLRQGLIERTGERNTTAYKLKINIA
jgi:hypothetical protein